MCGIVYVNRKDQKPAYKAVLKRFRAQRNRGSEGFGYIAIKEGRVVAYKRSPYEKDIIKLLEQEDAPEILFHHRFPTSVPNFEEGSHPILVDNGNGQLSSLYYIVHNGVIRNTEDLHEKHLKMGFKYTTEIEKGYWTVHGDKRYYEEVDWNDSESIAIETALVLERKQKTIDSVGAAAIIGFKVDQSGKVLERFFYRNSGNPLKYLNDDVMTTLTSEGSGEMVKDFRVYALTDDGKQIDYPGEYLMTPDSYYAAKTYHGNSEDYYEKHYGRQTTFRAKNDGIITRYPTGFDTTLTDNERAEREAADEEAFNFDEEEDTVEMPNIRSIGALLMEGVGMMWSTTDELWRIYQDVSDQIDVVNNYIAHVDNVVETLEIVSDTLGTRRLELQSKLDALLKMQEGVETELTRREGSSAANPDTPQLPSGREDPLDAAIAHANDVVEQDVAY
jgi:predicted glutamine amidotransferase